MSIAVDGRKDPALILAERAHTAFGEHFDEAQDARHRRAQLMCGTPQRLRPRLVERSQHIDKGGDRLSIAALGIPRIRIKPAISAHASRLVRGASISHRASAAADI